METGTAVAKTTGNLPALAGGWGRSGIDAADILIPKLLLMQPISEKVTEGLAKAGEILHSISGKAIPAPVEVIPLLTSKVWVVAEKVKGKFEYRRREPYTAANAAAEWNWTEKGSEWQRSQCIDCFCLLPKDIAREAAALAKLEKTGDTPEADDALLPVVLSFQRTSFKAGRAMTTHFAKLEAFGVPGASQTVSVTTVLEKNDKGSYYVFDLLKGRKSTPEELTGARKWWSLLTSNGPAAVQVHEPEYEDAADQARPVGPPPAAGKQKF